MMMTLQNHPLQYGSEYYPELEYVGDFKTTILNDLVNFRYRKNDYNSGVRLQIASTRCTRLSTSTLQATQRL